MSELPFPPEAICWLTAGAWIIYMVGLVIRTVVRTVRAYEARMATQFAEESEQTLRQLDELRRQYAEAEEPGHSRITPANPDAEIDASDLNALLQQCIDEGLVKVENGEVELYPNRPSRIDLLLEDEE